MEITKKKYNDTNHTRIKFVQNLKNGKVSDLLKMNLVGKYQGVVYKYGKVTHYRLKEDFHQWANYDYKVIYILNGKY